MQLENYADFTQASFPSELSPTPCHMIKPLSRLQTSKFSMTRFYNVASFICPSVYTQPQKCVLNIFTLARGVVTVKIVKDKVHILLVCMGQQTKLVKVICAFGDQKPKTCHRKCVAHTHVHLI
jgi:hypothetical protein